MRKPNLGSSLMISLIVILSFSTVQAQVGVWSNVKETASIKAKPAPRLTTPSKFRLMKLDMGLLDQTLAKSPDRNKDASKFAEIELPMPNGKFQKFKIQEASIMHPKLAAKYPHIKAYIGWGLDDRTATLRMTRGNDGFHAQILTAQHSTVYIDPYTFKDQTHYMSFYRDDLKDRHPLDHFECHVGDDESETVSESVKAFGDCQFRTFDLALACTGEYAQFHGGTVSDVNSAYNTTMARVNGIYERDASITMVLVSNNDNVIYLDGNTDPYSNNNGSAMLNQNQTTCDAQIGSNNYDIGHVFSTGGGGIAQLNSPCTSNKAKGVTGSANPSGDAFDVDYVAHEMGHQYGANHTFNNSCSGNRSDPNAYEPGSGNTIMAYAGICSPNVQSNSDDFFHARSLQEMANNVQNGNSSSCPTVTNPNNSAPVITNGSDYSIPELTPFFLDVNATDANSADVLTYTWDQYDKQITAQPPVATSTTGPMFKSFDPSTEDRRYFPTLSDVLAGNNPTWEVLPSVGRNMDFKITVRDNSTLGGCTDDDQVRVTTVNNIGPFTVTSQGSAIQWSSGSTETITWNVASTTSSPVNCSQVDILLSTDGGLTFPNIVMSNVTNDGSQNITVPNLPTSTGRIMVVCSNNIFYNVNGATIGIDMAPMQDYCDPAYTNSSCTSNDFIDDVTFNGISNLGSGCALSGNYSDYTAQSTTVDLGTVHTLTARACPNWDEYIVAAIDFNADGDFQDAGEFFDIGFVTMGTTGSISVTIPSGSSIGSTRMRVICEYGNNPIAQTDLCNTNFQYGEYEDYTIDINDPNGCPNDLIVTQNYNSGDVEDLEAGVHIDAYNIINGGADITYDAGTDVEMHVGFEVKAGAVFHAFIDGCGGTFQEEAEEDKK